MNDIYFIREVKKSIQICVLKFYLNNIHKFSQNENDNTRLLSVNNEAEM